MRSKRMRKSSQQQKRRQQQPAVHRSSLLLGRGGCDVLGSCPNSVTEVTCAEFLPPDSNGL
eukprot:1450586-Rhodomonas_salina.6